MMGRIKRIKVRSVPSGDAKKPKIEVVDDLIPQPESSYVIRGSESESHSSSGVFHMKADSLGKLFCAPHELFYLRNEKAVACWTSLPKLFGKVVALPSQKNNYFVQIEWVSTLRDGPSTDIPPELIPHLCPYFGAPKYGLYIQRLIRREIKNRDLASHASADNSDLALDNDSDSETVSTDDSEKFFLDDADFTNFNDGGYPVRTHTIPPDRDPSLFITSKPIPYKILFPRDRVTMFKPNPNP
jgi:hypothetical protein